MTSLSRIEQMIPGITAGLVLVIAIGAFILSFVNLRLQAIESGIPENLAFMWAVVIDALLISGSLMILRSGLRGERALSGWSVLFVFTGVSVFFNATHAPDSIIARIAHIVPPIALCISIEMVMQCIRSDLQHDATNVATLQHIAPLEETPRNKTRARNAGDAIHTFMQCNPTASIATIASACNVHPSTVSRHKKRMEVG